MSYSADFLLDIANTADCPRINREHDFGDQPFPAKDGWTVVIFYDAGDLDYIAHFLTPDGEEIDFWKWPESEDRDRLIAWRGRPTPEEIEQQAAWDAMSEDERAIYRAHFEMESWRRMVAFQQALAELPRQAFARTVAPLRDAIAEIKKIIGDSPKPATPRKRLRALKAHPRSARGRR